MKKSTLAAIIMAAIGLFGVGAYSINKQDASSSNSVQTTEQTTVQTEDKIVFREDGKSVTYQGEEGVTALATLKSLTKVNTESSNFGELVTGINEMQADSSKEYWSFYVNDQYSDEGAGTYQAKTGDRFKWQLEQLQ